MLITVQVHLLYNYIYCTLTLLLYLLLLFITYYILLITYFLLIWLISYDLLSTTYYLLLIHYFSILRTVLLSTYELLSIPLPSCAYDLLLITYYPWIIIYYLLLIIHTLIFTVHIYLYSPISVYLDANSYIDCTLTLTVYWMLLGCQLIYLQDSMMNGQNQKNQLPSMKGLLTISSMSLVVASMYTTRMVKVMIHHPFHLPIKGIQNRNTYTFWI